MNQFIEVSQMENQPSYYKQSLLQEVLHENVIKVTRQIIRPMSQIQRFEKAREHVVDALKYKHPRFQSQSLETPQLFKMLHHIQSSSFWEWLLFFCGYVFLYMVIWDNESYLKKIGIQILLLILFWTDILILMYCKKFDNFKKRTKYSRFFYLKVVIIILMSLDLILFIIFPNKDSRPIRPFRILRCFVPVLFDPEMRKSLISLASTYKDILIYFMFFGFIIVSYAIIGSRALSFDPNFTDPTYPVAFDEYKTDYNHLGHMIFMVYVTATYDSYPDNQILAIQNYEPNYIYYIAFIFLNMFIFSSIPGSLIYLRYRETRSKILLIDQIRQQHSLILAFVTLAENDANLSIDKLIKFLLFLYKYKIRYVGHIADICLKLDDHNNKFIQVNQFMQLSKILLENSAMLPPDFDDLEYWVKLRKYLNRQFHLKQKVKHWGFELIVTILVVMSTISAIFVLYDDTKAISIIDDFFIWLFLIQIIIRIVAIGPENFFADRWNVADTFLVLAGALFFIGQNQNGECLVRIFRFIRITSLLKILALNASKYFSKGAAKLEIYLKLKSIFSIILEILPIILRFMPLFLFFFYIYAIIGIQLFYNFYDTQGSPSYNQYQQFSNFKTFIHAQYIMVQVLTQAGWSQIAFDHCQRSPDYFAYIMLFFCFLHITIVYIIATLIKGIFWQVFFTVNTIFLERKKETFEEEVKERELNIKTTQILEINEAIQNNQYIEPNTIIRRQLIQNKFDQQIFFKLKKVYENDKNRLKADKSKQIKAHKLIQDWDINVDDLISQKSRLRYRRSSLKSITSLKSRMSIKEAQQIDEQDLQSQLQDLLDKLLVDPRLKYHEIVAHPKIFVEFLKSKFKSPEQLINEYQFNLHMHPLHNQESMYYHIYEINALLNIQTSKRQQKSLIIKNLIQQNILEQEQGQKLLKKKLHEKIFNVDTSGTLRKMFLAQTNEHLIKNFQIQYFSDLYGYSYRHINKLTLEPLLKLEATLTYSLRNIMRYPQINNTQFFEMVTNIQDQISNQLLQRGSLFKFVYKLKYEGDIWFSIQYKRQQQMRVHFIKSGLWCYNKDMHEKQVLFARDVFNWDFNGVIDQNTCQKYLKRFYQGFEGLAFSLLNEEQFFVYNPKDHVYDLYIQHFDVQKLVRFKQKKIEITKIMVVILSRQQQRADIGLLPLDYTLTELKGQNNRKKSQSTFKLDESDDETFQKLKNIAAMESERIVQSEGLPFSYIVNLMKEISDIVTIYGENFVYQIQKVLNEQYEEKKNIENMVLYGSDFKSSKQNVSGQGYSFINYNS